MGKETRPIASRSHLHPSNTRHTPLRLRELPSLPSQLTRTLTYRSGRPSFLSIANRLFFTTGFVSTCGAGSGSRQIQVISGSGRG